MKNFKQELIKTFEIYELSLQDIKCGYVNKSICIHIGFDDNDVEITEHQKEEFQLKMFQTQHNFDLWLESLNFNFDLDNAEEDDTRSEEQIEFDYENISISINGTIWLHNGDWLEWDYGHDFNFESWHLHKIKHIPLNLL